MERVAAAVVLMVAGVRAVAAKDVEEQGRLLFVPITDVFSYNQVVVIGFSMLLVVLAVALYLIDDSAGYDTASGYTGYNSGYPNRRNGLLTKWTDQWYNWMPVLDTLMTAMDKYRDKYHAAAP